MSGLTNLASLVVLAQVLRGLLAANDQEVVAFHSSGKAGDQPALELLTPVAAPADKLVALLGDPATYRRAVPAFIRAEVLTERRGADAATGERLIAWELEVPLWNLKGRLWLRPRPDGVDLQLVEGDLAPGKLALRAEPQGTGALLRLAGAANLKNANFMTRRLAARDREAEPAMSVTAMYVLLRALALEAARPQEGGKAGAPAAQRRPRGPMSAGALVAHEGRARDLVARLGATDDVFARVTSRADGRLAAVEVAVPLAIPAATASTRLLEPTRWQALPGWKHVTKVGSRPVRWQVDASLPFVDFDATWTLQGERPFRAEAQGDWAGAAIAAEVFPRGAGADAATLIFTAHPRVDATGYIPRKLIEAEPLLEHGLALGLAYVDALALGRALAAPAPPAGPAVDPGGAGAP